MISVVASANMNDCVGINMDITNLDLTKTSFLSSNFFAEPGFYKYLDSCVLQVFLSYVYNKSWSYKI